MAGTWIESHQALGGHPKAKRLARLLGVHLRDAVGLLHYLWWWAVDYAPDGTLDRYADADLAEAVLWDGDPAELVEALRDAGWLDVSTDGVLTIHDWDEYAGRLLAQRRAAAERKRAWRQARDGDGPGTGPVAADEPARGGVVQDLPDRTTPTGPTRAARPRGNASLGTDVVAQLVDEFASKLGSEQAVRDAITAAMNHTAVHKAIDTRLYVRRWLQRDVAARVAPHGSTRLPTSGVRHV